MLLARMSIPYWSHDSGFVVDSMIASKGTYIIIMVREEKKFNPPHINTSYFKLTEVLLCPNIYFSYKFISDGYALET